MPTPSDLDNLNIALIAITKHGVEQMTELASQLSHAHIVAPDKYCSKVSHLNNHKSLYEGSLKDQVAAIFSHFDQLVFFVSLGAVVRLIAPHLQSKDTDPGVTVIDDHGQYVIPVLSGHVGGANACAESIAKILDAQAVLTTASDVNQTIPVDILGRELGWTIEAPKINITRVSAAVVNGEPIAFIQEAGVKTWWNRSTPLPSNIHLFDRFEDVDLDRFRAFLWVTQRTIDGEIWDSLPERLVAYRPPVSRPPESRLEVT